MTTVRLERLSADHEEALLAFERENRAYFARSITDRGDAFFAAFGERMRAWLAAQDDGVDRFHVIFDEKGALVGRVNLMEISAEGDAKLGYRIAEAAAGRGVATAAVVAVCRLAAAEYGLTALVAEVAVTNPASRTVVERNGFVLAGETEVGGRPAWRYRRALTSQPTA